MSPRATKKKGADKSKAVIPGAELMEALDILEKEKSISKDKMFEAISNSLITACKNHFKSADNVRIDINKETCDFHVIATKEVIELAEDVMDPAIEISWDDAKLINPEAEVGGFVDVEINSKEFGRIATQNAKNVITQKIREEERNVVIEHYSKYKGSLITGVLQHESKNRTSWNVNLGKADALLLEKEMVPGEVYAPNKRMKFYVVDVERGARGPKISVSRTHPELVKRLFEDEVMEIKDGIVEIKAIAREAGSRTKMAVYSNNPNVDPVGACVGVNGARVNAIVNELQGEKIDIISWDENKGNFICNALSPAQIVNIFADPDEKTANVVVPDDQLSLAIGKEGQNARLAARLTGFKIDIKSETQAKDAFGFRIEDYMDDEEDYDYEENEDSEYMDYDGSPADYEESGEYADDDADSTDSSDEE
ncbi:MAG: transcription termination factor NusA [Lachnospiraceae bacterium]